MFCPKKLRKKVHVGAKRGNVDLRKARRLLVHVPSKVDVPPQAFSFKHHGIDRQRHRGIESRAVRIVAREAPEPAEPPPHFHRIEGFAVFVTP